jgi:hypothetical protein
MESDYGRRLRETLVALTGGKVTEMRARSVDAAAGTTAAWVLGVEPFGSVLSDATEVRT